MHGRFGVLEDDGERVRCHLCGKRYKLLGNHVKKTHGMDPDEYREMFGLMRSTGLLSRGLAQTLSEKSSHLRDHDHDNARILAEHGARGGRVVSPEERMRPGLLENAAAASRERAARAWAAGEYHAPRECAVCGSAFRVRSNNRRKTCSDACSSELMGRSARAAHARRKTA